MNEPTPVNGLYASVPVIDQNLRAIQEKLSKINGNLNDGIFGVSDLKCEKDEADKTPTTSLSSIARKVNDILTQIATCEEYVQRIYPSNEDCCDTTVASH